MACPDRLEKIYDDHASALFRFLIRLTGNEEETRDLLQEIFVRLARKPDLLDKVTAPRSYLFRLAHRLAIDRHRREQTRLHYDDRAYQNGETFSSPEITPTDEAWTQKVLGQSLEKLPRQQRSVVLLKVWEEMTFAEIAAILEISPNTAASRYRYALDKLREDLRPLSSDLP